MLKILSWNIRQGGGSRRNDIVTAISKCDAQIVILSEYRNNKSGNAIIENLKKFGYKNFTHSNMTSNSNGVLLCSKMKFETILNRSSDNDYPQNVMIGDYGAIIVIGVYLPHKKKHSLFDILKSYSHHSKPVVIAGDFNTGINGIDQVGNSFWYETEFKDLLSNGFIDCFRHINGDLKDYSWYSHQGNGYRYDHTLISKEIASMVISCSYLHEWREVGYSDHSPMLLEIG